MISNCPATPFTRAKPSFTRIYSASPRAVFECLAQTDGTIKGYKVSLPSKDLMESCVCYPLSGG
jgi:hypothetical protein